ncbi:MAG: gliding motility-associated ABC transporter substrate-binding protein GldG [Flavobacteriales bacterium CG_4_9_14_0_2_um_filter_35_242]|nr:MAG: gliding motility-associated ABC transporter substrate-binding protein GldG [Flavobacteriales bacterium CG_4_8_14_3_um_filter_35_10]PJC60006.1 MAG: gliding motility-associated ABC transporter substrate-binding protein GldG [Flavobacteriales bacterium CG_4_9_14_0_2_um_filter_35_242]
MSKYIAKILAFFILLNLVSYQLYKRFDLTQDQRYSFSKTTKDVLDKIDKPLAINIYLEGDFPLDFKRLQTETEQILQEYSLLNKNIIYRFINPLTDKDLGQDLIKKGFQPSRLTIQDKGEISEKVIFPWAEINYNGKLQKVNLLPESQSFSQSEQINHAISKLEYSFTDAFTKISQAKKYNIAVLKGNGELDDLHLYSFLKSLGSYYNLAPFTLDSVSSQPQKTLIELVNFDLLIIAKPSQKFSEAEKYTLDQYIMNQGKTLWLLDQVQADLDSLAEQEGELLAFPNDLNLTDLLFSYGIRPSYDLVLDLYAAKIRLASGEVNGKPQYQNFDWPYFPLITSDNHHPITNHIAPVQLKFSTAIDTLKNKISKQVLLQSSNLSKKVGTPRLVSLQELNAIEKDTYTNGNQILGILLSGEFNSAYSGRVKPYNWKGNQDLSAQNSMIIIADGDIGSNQIYQNRPTDLNQNFLTGEQFGNKDFLLNSVNFLLGDTGLLSLRSKTLKISFLDKELVVKTSVFWQVLNVIAPLVILLLFGLGFRFYRKLKYART